jgi:hypothetical protein
MPSRILTFGDICSAIAEGQLSVASDGSVYKINALELRRYFNRFRPLPSILPVNVSNATSCPGSSNKRSAYSPPSGL